MFEHETTMTIENQEPFTELEIYSINNIPSIDCAEDISNLFLNNYPEMYPDDTKEADFARYDSAEKILEQVNEGNIFIVAKIEGKVIAMTKFRQERRKKIAGCDEWLGSWIMVDKKYRSSRIGKKLFDKTIEMLRELKKVSRRKMFFVADVHKENTPSINFCKKMV